MTSHIDPTDIGRATGGLARDGATQRPVKLVEHPAFRGRRVPSAAFGTLRIEHIADAYAAMDERRSIKSLLRVAPLR